MTFTKSLAVLASKVRCKAARKGNSKLNITTISEPFNVSKSMSPVLEQMYDDKLFLIELCNPTSPPRKPTFPLKHKVQLPSAHAEQQQPATSLTAQQQDIDHRNFNHSSDATSEHQHLDKDLPRCQTPSEQLFSPSAPASPNTSSRSTRTPSPLFDSVTSFDMVDSPAISTTTDVDRFTELPPRVFPLRRTARVQSIVPTPLDISSNATIDAFTTLFSGPSPSSSTHSLASLASFGDRLPLAKDIESGLVRMSHVTAFTPATTSNDFDTLFSGPSRSCSVNSLASLALADSASLAQDIKMGIVSVGQVNSYRSRALPATPAVRSEGCFAIVEGC